MNLKAALSLFGVGTSEGVTKAWDTRGRGRNPNDGQKQSYEPPVATQRTAQTYQVGYDNLGPITQALTKAGFKWERSDSALDSSTNSAQRAGRQSGSYSPFATSEYSHPAGHSAVIEARMRMARNGIDWEPESSTAALHLTASPEIHKLIGPIASQKISYMDSAAGGQTDSSSFIGRKYTVVDTRYGHYISEHDKPEEAEHAARARPYSKVVSQPQLSTSPVVRDMARQRLVKTNPDVT